MNRIHLILRPLVVAAALCAGPVEAATFCVATEPELSAALIDAGDNAAADEIRIQRGSIAAITPMLQDYSFYFAAVDGADLTLSGGWNTGCTQQQQDPFATVLFPAPDTRLFRLHGGGSGSGPLFTLRNLTLAGGNTPNLTACAIESGGTHRFQLERAVVSDFTCNGAAVAVQTNGGALVVRGSLFQYNQGAGSVVLWGYQGSTPPVQIIFSGNTVVNNRTSSGQLLVRLPGSPGTSIENNVFWNNSYPEYDSGRREIEWAGAETIRNNLMQFPQGPFTHSGNLSGIDPQFESPGRFVPGRNSPLRNAGRADAIGGQPMYDLGGSSRLGEGALDIGAYEYAGVFSDSFE